MRFWLNLVTAHDADHLIELAQHAEALGFFGVSCSDHLAPTAQVTSPYPYNATGRIPWNAEAPWLDCWSALSVLATHTSKLQLGANVYLAALRDPFTFARSVATSATIAHGRLVCGVAAGWMAEEYAALGIDFTSRGRRLDEVLTAARKLWSGEAVSHEGEFFKFDSVMMRPSPPSRVPVWVGGVSPPAVRRAALHDGWCGVPASLDENIAIVRRLHVLRREAGLPLETFRSCVALKGSITEASIRALEDASIHDLSIIPWAPNSRASESYAPAGADVTDISVQKDTLTHFSDRVIRRFG